MTGAEKFAQLTNTAKRKAVVLPSMLLCDFSNLSTEVDRLHDAGVQGFHLDVMDGNFVPNFTYGPPIVAAFRRLTDLPIDVHLMIEHPGQYIGAFVDAGADAITFHPAPVADPVAVLESIRRHDVAAGLAINPATTVQSIGDALPLCDLVCVMSVNAGFGGQSFQPAMLEKFSQIRERIGEDVILEIDGGINTETIPSCVSSGAELLVVGSALLKQPDYRVAMNSLTAAIG